MSPAPVDAKSIEENGVSGVMDETQADTPSPDAAKDVEAVLAAKASKTDEREAKEQAKRVERMKKATAKAEAKKNKKERKGPKFFWKLVDYFKNVKVEMKRVVWPSRKEVGRMSAVVIVALLFFGVLIYVVDSVVVPLLDMYSSLGG